MKHLTPALAMFALVVLLFGGYVGAYLWLGEFMPVVDRTTGRRAYERDYNHEWLALAF